MFWVAWEDVILAYSNASGHKSVGLKHALCDWSHLQITKFACDSEFEDDIIIIFLIKEYQLLHS